MHYLYIDFPKTKQIRDFSSIKIGDSLEIRLSEIEEYVDLFFKKMSQIKCNKIELELKESNDAYGHIQVFRFL